SSSSQGSVLFPRILASNGYSSAGTVHHASVVQTQLLSGVPIGRCGDAARLCDMVVCLWALFFCHETYSLTSLAIANAASWLTLVTHGGRLSDRFVRSRAYAVRPIDK